MGAVLSLLIKVIGLVLSVLLLPVKLALRVKNSSAREVKRRLAQRDFTRQRPASTFGRYVRGQEYFNVRPDGELQLPVAAEGVGSLEPVTILEAFERAVKRHGEKTALQWQSSAEADFRSWTWEEYYNDTLQAAKAFIHLGMKPFQSVNIIGFNSPQWFLANLGAIFAGGKAAGIYTTNDAEACEYITKHSEAHVVVVEDAHQLAKFASVEASLRGQVAAYVVYSPSKGDEAKQQYTGSIPVYTWAEFMALGDKVADDELRARMDAQRPSHCCTLIYTSGTTGVPKAVMITHDNMTWTAQMIMQEIPEMGQHPEHLISYLPLSHVAAQMIDIHGPIMLAANFRFPATVWFARPDALRGSLRDTLRAARPTMFFGVPRVWEKFREALLAARRGGLLGAIGDWAKSVATQKFEASQLGSDADVPLEYPLAKLLLGKVRAALGLDRCRYCLSGAAPISKDVLDYFGSLDIPIHQVYGMSECTGPATLDLPQRSKNGSVGPALPGIEIKLDHEPGRDRPNEGEICYRGRNIMMGYMGNEDKTRESIDDEGWLHSGDVGRFDENGFVFITDRIKNLIITAGGENAAPQPIEDKLLSLLPALSNIVMIGDRRKFCTMIVTLKTEPIPETGAFSDRLAGAALEVDPACTTVKDAQESELWQRYIDQGRLEYNQKFAPSNATKIQYFRILPTDFSVAEGDLTATLKLKRSVVAEKYSDVIESMYK